MSKWKYRTPAEANEEIERLQKLVLDGDTTIGGPRAALWRENKRLRAALEFYANERHYMGITSKIHHDRGKISREALQEGES